MADSAWGETVLGLRAMPESCAGLRSGAGLPDVGKHLGIEFWQ